MHNPFRTGTIADVSSGRTSTLCRAAAAILAFGYGSSLVLARFRLGFFVNSSTKTFSTFFAFSSVSGLSADPNDPEVSRAGPMLPFVVDNRARIGRSHVLDACGPDRAVFRLANGQGTLSKFTAGSHGPVACRTDKSTSRGRAADLETKSYQHEATGC